MNTALIVTIIVVVVVVILLLAIFFAVRRSRARRQEQQRERTRQEFGSEYERTAREKGSEEEAERELRRRRGSVERNIEPLPDERREHFEAQWGEVERVFVENPEKSIEMADRTVSDILHERRFVTDSSRATRRRRRTWPSCTPTSPTTTARPAACGRTWWPGRAEAPARTWASSPPRICARPSSGTGPSTVDS